MGAITGSQCFFLVQCCITPKFVVIQTLNCLASCWYCSIPCKFFLANQIHFCYLAIFQFLLIRTTHDGLFYQWSHDLSDCLQGNDLASPSSESLKFMSEGKTQNCSFDMFGLSEIHDRKYNTMQTAASNWKTWEILVQTFWEGWMGWVLKWNNSKIEVFLPCNWILKVLHTRLQPLFLFAPQVLLYQKEAITPW